MAPAANPATFEFNGAKRRIPRLAVRNRLAVEKLPPSSTPSPPPDDGAGDELTAAALSLVSTRPGLSAYHSDDSRESSGHTAPQDGGRDRLAGKKCGSGLLGFLTVKEPSISAWKVLAEAQEKIAAEGGGRTIRMPSMSSRQLPAHVPKTNSKWDGLPNTARRRSIDLRTKRQCQTSSKSSAGRVNSAKGRLGSGNGDNQPATHGRASSVASKDVLRNDSRSTQLSQQDIDHSPSASISSHKPAVVPPALRDNVIAPWDETSLPQERRDATVAPWDEAPLRQGKRNTKVAPWDEPVAGPADVERLATRFALSKMQGHQSTFDISGHVRTSRSGIDSGRRAPSNTAKLNKHQGIPPNAMITSTINELPLKPDSDDNIKTERRPHTRPALQQAHQVSEPESASTGALLTSDRSTTQPLSLSRATSQSTSSSAPAELSAQWFMPQTNRFRLGSKVTGQDIADVLPWEFQEPDRGVAPTGSGRRLCVINECSKLKRPGVFKMGRK